MNDEKIIALYLAREESALLETKLKYGNYCRAVAFRILQNREDAEECENDTYLDAWNAIPPHRPPMLSVFLGTITRRIAIDKLRKKYASRRGGGEAMLSLQELEECVPMGKSMDDSLDEKLLAKAISAFLQTLDETNCNIFLRRYWHLDSVAKIAQRYSFSQSKVKAMLKRTRKELLVHLEKEGFFL